MKKYSSDTARSRLFLHEIIFRFAAVLLFLTLLSTRLVGGLYAQYSTYGSNKDKGRAATGLPIIGLTESKAVMTDENGGITYKLDTNTKVTNNNYESITPGMTIPKDPTITLNGIGEIKFELYLQVTEENFSHGMLDYTLENGWTSYDSSSEVNSGVYVYKYTGTISNPTTTIKILKDDKLYVNPDYDENGQPFSLTFEAWMETVD